MANLTYAPWTFPGAPSGGDIVGVGVSMCIAPFGVPVPPTHLIVEIQSDNGSLTYPSGEVLATATIPLTTPTDYLPRRKVQPPTYNPVYSGPWKTLIGSIQGGEVYQTMVGWLDTPLPVTNVGRPLWIVVHTPGDIDLGGSVVTISYFSGPHPVGLWGSTFDTMTSFDGIVAGLDFGLIQRNSPVVWVWEELSGTLGPTQPNGMTDYASSVTLDAWMVDLWDAESTPPNPPYFGRIGGGVDTFYDVQPFGPPTIASNILLTDTLGTFAFISLGDGVNGFANFLAGDTMESSMTFQLDYSDTVINPDQLQGWTGLDFFLQAFPAFTPFTGIWTPPRRGQSFAQIIG